ncbi:glycosyltransferase 87 family protein [Lentzea sp. NPDC042327]|uniref:glycosyltransferase 87 family protein n=1 Tax=Lentzea sp. NPDC042327 TaxID=3154801 RepID=UPI0033D7353C
MLSPAKPSTTASPTAPRARFARPAALVAAVVATSVALALVAHAVYTRDPYWGLRWTVDLKVYLASGQAVRDGRSLYDLVVLSPLYGPMSYTYPPLAAAAIFAPLSFLPAGAAGLLWNTASLAALGAVVWLTVRIAGVRRHRGLLVVAGLVLVSLLLPVRVQLIAGQINAFLLLLVLLDFRPGAGRWRGVGIGIAAGLKITPLLFIGYLLVTRQWAAARTAALAFLGTVAAGFLVAPGDSARYWGGLVLESSRVADVYVTPNQSLPGALARALGTVGFDRSWLPVLALVAVCGLAVARSAHRRGSDFLGFSAAAVTSLLVSPVSWEHHWVWVVPLLVWLAAHAHLRRSPGLAVLTAVVFVVFAVRWFALLDVPEVPPLSGGLTVWQQLAAGLWPLTGLLLLPVVLAAARAPALSSTPAARAV